MTPDNDDTSEFTKPAAAAKPKAAQVHPVAALPRYTHGLLGQSLVGSRMLKLL